MGIPVTAKILGFAGSGFENRAAASLYIAAVSYGITLAMLNVLVPLYALHLGYNLKTMGAIISSQAVFQLGLRLFGGILSDRFGERLVLLLSFLSVLVASALFIFVSQVAGLVGAQVFVGFSRSIYWNAAHSYGSRVSEVHSGRILARFLGYSSGGEIVGAAIAGVAAVALGYPAAFAVCTGFCAAALATSLIMPSIPRLGAIPTMKQIMKPLPRLFTSKILWLGIIVAFVSSAQSAMVGSSYPAFFSQELKFSAAQIGFYRSVYSGGLVIIGFAFGALMVRFGQKSVYSLCMLGMGALTLVTPGIGYLVLPLAGTMMPLAVMVLGGLMLALGCAFGISRVLYTVVAAENSVPGERGMAMSVVGLGWAFGQLLIPVLFGYVADLVGLANSFYIAGVAMIMVGLSTPLLYRWLAPHPETR